MRLQVEQRLRALFQGSAARVGLTSFADTQQPARAVPTKLATGLGEPEVPRSQCCQHPRHYCSAQPDPRAGMCRTAGTGPGRDGAHGNNKDGTYDPNQSSASLHREHDGRCALAGGCFHRGTAGANNGPALRLLLLDPYRPCCQTQLGLFVSHPARPPRHLYQTRLKTSVPLVPPKPKLFFTATSIFISRAVLAQ